MSDLLVPLILAGIIIVDIALVIFLLVRSSNAKPAIPVGPEKPARQARWWEWLLLTLFCLGWSGITLTADGMAVRSAVKQFHALSFSEVEGSVLSCAVLEKPGSEGPTYSVDIEYVYRVAEVDYRGKRVRYYALFEKRWVEKFVAAHPAGTTVTVYFDPSNPAEAILLPDFDGGLLWMAMFLVPFNLAMIAIFVAGIWFWFGGTDSRQPLQTTECNGIVRVSCAPPASVVALTVLGAVAMLAGVFVALCCGMPPSVTTMVIAWGFVLVLPFLAWWQVKRLTREGYYNLELDVLKRTLNASAFWTGGNSVAMPFADVDSIEVVDWIDSEKNVTYRIIARGKAHETRLAEFSDKDAADELATWLRIRIVWIGHRPP